MKRLARINVIIAADETEFSDIGNRPCLIDVDRIEAVYELEEATHILMYSGDYHITTLSLDEVDQLIRETPLAWGLNGPC